MKLESLLHPKRLIAVLMVCVGLIYIWNSDGELMFDDEQQLNHVSGFSSVTETFTVDCFGFFRPVKNLVFYAWTNAFPENYQAWRITAAFAYVGLIPIVYWFFGLFYQKNEWSRLLATAFWVSLPATTTVVSWISSTNIILGGYGFFLYFILYEKAQKAQLLGKLGLAYTWLFGALLTLAFACFSYEAAMAAPFLLVFKDFVRNSERLKDKRTWMFFFLSITTLILYFLLRKHYGSVTNIPELATIHTNSDALVSLSSGWFYLIHAIRGFFPFGQQGILIVFNPEEHKLLVILSAIVVVSLVILLFKSRIKQPLLFLGLGWYGLALFPMANVIPLRNGPICDYYLFLPGIGLALFVAWLVQSALQTKMRNFAIGISIIWIAGFLVTTASWSYNWKSKMRLAEETLKWQPDNYISLGIMVHTEMDLGNYEVSQSYLDRGMEVADWYSPFYYHQVMLHLKQEKYVQAVALLNELVEKQKDLAKPYVILAYVKDVSLGKWQEAEKLLMTSLEKPWDPKYSKAGAMNLAYIYLRTDRRPFAQKVYESLLAQYPSDTEIAENLRSIKNLGKVDADVQDPTKSL